MVPGCPSPTTTSQSPSLLKVDLALGLPLDIVDRVEAVITLESSKLSTSSLTLMEGRADASSGVTGLLPSAFDSYPSEWTSSSRDFSDECLEDISSLDAWFFQHHIRITMFVSAVKVLLTTSYLCSFWDKQLQLDFAVFLPLHFFHFYFPLSQSHYGLEASEFTLTLTF